NKEQNITAYRSDDWELYCDVNCLCGGVQYILSQALKLDITCNYRKFFNKTLYNSKWKAEKTRRSLVSNKWATGTHCLSMVSFTISMRLRIVFSHVLKMEILMRKLHKQ